MYTGSIATFSNRENWLIQGSLTDDDGSDVDLSTSSLEFYITREGCPNSAELTATTDNGDITLPTTTSFQVAFTPDDVSKLCGGTYDAYLRVTISSTTTQIIAGTIQVLEGGPQS